MWIHGLIHEWDQAYLRMTAGRRREPGSRRTVSSQVSFHPGTLMALRPFCSTGPHCHIGPNYPIEHLSILHGSGSIGAYGDQFTMWMGAGALVVKGTPDFAVVEGASFRVIRRSSPVAGKRAVESLRSERSVRRSNTIRQDFITPVEPACIRELTDA